MLCNVNVTAFFILIFVRWNSGSMRGIGFTDVLRAVLKTKTSSKLDRKELDRGNK
jgi:hypothetical protein